MSDFRVNTSAHINVREAPSVLANVTACLVRDTIVTRMAFNYTASDGLEWTFVQWNADGILRGGWMARVWPTWEQQLSPVSTAPVPTVQGKWRTPIIGSYRVTQEFGNSGHVGTDLGGAVGLTVVAAASGQVVKVGRCTRCTVDRPNFASQGVAQWDAEAIADPAWGYGFGNYVIVRYDLPRQSLYVVYAHLSAIHIAEQAIVVAGDRLGALGNTGNSTGAHLHLEVRASPTPTTASIFQLPAIDPREMFVL